MRSLSLVRTNEVIRRLGMSKSSFYAKIKARTFPPLISTSDRMTAYEEGEINVLIAAIMRKTPESEMMVLSREIEENRNTLQ